MADALLRNVYGDDPAKRKQAEILARYVQRELACLALTESESVMSGKLKFSTDFLGGEQVGSEEQGSRAAWNSMPLE